MGVLDSSSEVLLISSNFPPVIGGSATVYAYLAREARGRIRVLAPSRSYQDGREFESWRTHDEAQSYPVRRIPLLRTPLRRKKDRWQYFRLWSIFHEVWLRLRITLVVFQLLVRHPVSCVCIGELVGNGWLARLLKYWPRLTTAIYVHGEELTTVDGYDANHKRRAAFLRAADEIIAVSSFTAEVVKQFVGQNARVTVLRNGVDFQRFSSDKTQKPGLPHGWEECFIFVSVCRLVPKKGLDQALRAFSRIVAEYPHARFLLVGTGEDEQRLKSICAEERLDRVVLFVGRVAADLLPAYYKTGDAFVMPNRQLENGDTEGFGLVFLEANAAGLPVIAGNDGGSVDAVTDGDNGLVVDGKSVDEITNAMRRLLMDGGLRERLAKNGTIRAKNNDWSIKAQKFLRLCLGC